MEHSQLREGMRSGVDVLDMRETVSRRDRSSVLELCLGRR